MIHLAAFAQSVDPAAALTPITAAREQTLFTSTVDLRVPSGLNNIIGAAALANDASGSRAQIQSPSLRVLTNLDVEPVILAAVFGNPPESLLHPSIAIPLAPDEALNFAFLSDPAAAALHYGLVWLADGPQQPAEGTMFSIRATGTAQQVVADWVNGSFTFAQTLPAGRYAIIGMRCRSTDGVAARLVFPEQIARPGVPVVNAIADEDPWYARFGAMGMFGEFPHTNPPTFDIIGGVAAAQTFILDMLRVG